MALERQLPSSVKRGTIMAQFPLRVAITIGHFKRSNRGREGMISVVFFYSMCWFLMIIS